MSKSRHILVLSLTTLFVLTLGTLGWCGGPVGPSPAPRVEQSTPQGFAGGVAEGAARGGFSMSANAGTANVNGVDGTSPYVDFNSLMNSGRGQLALTFKASYVPKLAPNFKITGQWVTGGWGGWTQNYSGPPNPYLVNGLSAGCKLNLNLYSLRAEYDVNCYDAVNIGPRIEWLQYADTFTLYGPDYGAITSPSSSKGHSFAMFGLGFAGCIKFAKLAGDFGFSPTVNFSAMLGAGSKMDYWSWDVYVTVFKHKREQPSRFWPFTASIWDLGYAQYTFRYKSQDDPIWVAAPDGYAGWVPGDAVRYTLGLPSARVTFAF